MKRLLLAMLLALAGHALLFWWGRDLVWKPAEMAGPRQVPLHLELVAQPAATAPERPTAEPEPPAPPPAASPTPPRPEPETASEIRPESLKATVAEPAPEPEPPPIPPRPEWEPEPAAHPEPELPPQSASPTAAPAAPGPAPPRESGPAAPAEAEAEIIMARPLYRENPPPPYPPAARQRFYQGTVLLAVLVNEQGRVEELKVAASSGHPLLDRAALNGVRDWRFEPGRRNGEAVAMWVQVPIRFALE